MRTILLHIDGTTRSDAAVHCVIRQARLGEVGTIHLVNVQPQLGKYIGRFLQGFIVRDFHREQGEKALAHAKSLLNEAGVAYIPHIYAGDTAETIAKAAKELGVDEIVMSSSNLAVIGDLDLHTVVGRVLRRVNVPVSVVNNPAADMAIDPPTHPWGLRPTP